MKNIFPYTEREEDVDPDGPDPIVDAIESGDDLLPIQLEEAAKALYEHWQTGRTAFIVAKLIPAQALELARAAVGMEPCATCGVYDLDTRTHYHPYRSTTD